MCIELVVREDQRELSRKILEEVQMVPFSLNLGGPNKGCNMNSVMDSKAYGYITMADALKRDWKIYDYKTDELLGAFKTLNELFDAGWKVST
jgi:hypothetical protein